MLGKIHLEMCKYHESGRFLEDVDDLNKIDYEAAFFHLKMAANLGEIEALVSIAKIYMQIPHDVLPDYKIQVCFIFVIVLFCSYFRTIPIQFCSMFL